MDKAELQTAYAASGGDKEGWSSRIKREGASNFYEKSVALPDGRTLNCYKQVEETPQSKYRSASVFFRFDVDGQELRRSFDLDEQGNPKFA